MASIIYGLVDPRTGKIRYVGKSDRPTDRYSEHLNDARKGLKRRREFWIRKLFKMGLQPGILYLERVEQVDGWQIAEREAIKYYRSRGYKLTNETPGGDGMSEVTPEIRIKMSAGRKASKRALATSLKNLRKAQEAAWAIPWTDERKQYMSKLFTGRTVSEETRAKISTAKIGQPPPNRKLNPAEEEAICAEYRSGERTVIIAERWHVRRGFVSDLLRRHGVPIRPHSLLPEQVEKMRLGKTGKKQTPEHAAARAAGVKRHTKDRDDLMVADYVAGMRPTAIAKKYGVDRTTVHNALKRQAVPPRGDYGPSGPGTPAAQA